MDDNELQLIQRLKVYGSNWNELEPLSNSNFLNMFRGGKLSAEAIVMTAMSEAIDSQNSEQANAAMKLGVVFGFVSENIPMLRTLAYEPWHAMHEDIVSAFIDICSPESVDVLYFLASWVPGNVVWDENRPLARNAVYALAKISKAHPSASDARTALEAVVNRKEEKVSDLAAELLADLPVDKENPA